MSTLYHNQKPSTCTHAASHTQTIPPLLTYLLCLSRKGCRARGKMKANHGMWNDKYKIINCTKLITVSSLPFHLYHHPSPYQLIFPFLPPFITSTYVAHLMLSTPQSCIVYKNAIPLTPLIIYFALPTFWRHKKIVGTKQHIYTMHVNSIPQLKA